MAVKNLSIPLFILGLGAVAPAHAEGDPLVFIDVFGGYSWSQHQDAEVAMPLGGVPSKAKFNDLDIYNGPAFGGRVGFWLKTTPSIGLAIDTTVFDTDVERQVANVVVGSGPAAGNYTIGTTDVGVSNTLVSLDLIVRQKGKRFTPYAFVGPGLMFADLDDGGAFGQSKQDDSDLAFGYKLGFGISYEISETMHIFTEYRYIHSDLEFDLGQSVDPLVPPTSIVSTNIDIDTDTHFAVGGLSIRF